MTMSDTSVNKKLKHVRVYDQLYEQILNGTYPAGSQLPSETLLSEHMGVSRMTLAGTSDRRWHCKKCSRRR